MSRLASLKVNRRYTDRAFRRQIDHQRLTVHQLAFLSDSSDIVLDRGGNQVGKTRAGHLDLIHTARGTHPFQDTPKPPVNLLVLSESWDQMGQAGGFMEKLWALLPKDEIDPKIRLEPGRGITGKPPRIVFVNGPGKGTVITFATYRQGAARVAGSTIHRVYLDEPGPASLHEELVPRLLRYGGKMRIMFTPVLDMPDQTWIRELVTSGEISEHNPWLTEQNCWPTGAPFPWVSQAQIDKMMRTLPEATRNMRMRGSWEPVLTHKWLTNYNDDLHVNESRPPMGAYLSVGLDHGAMAGKQTAAIVSTAGRESLNARAWVMAETLSDGRSTPRQDARAIIRMLADVRLSWQDVDDWVGDRSLGSSRYVTRKSNQLLRRYLAEEVNIPLSAFPKINTPIKYPGSVEQGLHMMNALLGELDEWGVPSMLIHPRCLRFREFCDKFAGDRADPLKDIGDAVRYALERAVKHVPHTHMLARY